jgi:hypothetical protein
MRGTMYSHARPNKAPPNRGAKCERSCKTPGSNGSARNLGCGWTAPLEPDSNRVNDVCLGSWSEVANCAGGFLQDAAPTLNHAPTCLAFTTTLLMDRGKPFPLAGEEGTRGHDRRRRRRRNAIAIRRRRRDPTEVDQSSNGWLQNLEVGDHVAGLSFLHLSGPFDKCPGIRLRSTGARPLRRNILAAAAYFCAVVMWAPWIHPRRLKWLARRILPVPAPKVARARSIQPVRLAVV